MDELRVLKRAWVLWMGGVLGGLVCLSAQSRVDPPFPLESTLSSHGQQIVVIGGETPPSPSREKIVIVGGVDLSNTEPFSQRPSPQEKTALQQPRSTPSSVGGKSPKAIIPCPSVDPNFKGEIVIVGSPSSTTDPCSHQSQKNNILPSYPVQGEITLKPGNKRTLTTLDVMIPVLSHRQHDLLFVDLRGVKDNKSSREFNAGLGYRRAIGWFIADEPVTLGGYGYYDIRRSSNGFTYRQGTAGLEALHPLWQARVNGYYPDQNEHLVFSSSGFFQGYSYILNNGKEGALPGFDFEFGVRAPVPPFPSNQDLFLFAGGYQFRRAGYPTIEGPRFRLEYWIYDILDSLGLPNARLKIGAEMMYDKVRGRNNFFEIGFMMPLSGFARQVRYTPLDRTMILPVRRDPDAVTATKSAVLQINGSPVTFIHVNGDAPDDTATGTNTDPYKTPQAGLNAAIAQGKHNPVVVLHPTAGGGGSAPDYQAANNASLMDVSTALPSTMTLLSPSNSFRGSNGATQGSGRQTILKSTDNDGTDLVGTIQYTAAGAPLVINGLNAQMEATGASYEPSAAFADNGGKIYVVNSTLQGLGTDGRGMYAQNNSSISVINTTITSNGASGIDMKNSTVSINGSQITTAGDDAAAVRLLGTQASIHNSTLTSTHSDYGKGLYAEASSTVSITDSTLTSLGQYTSCGAQSLINSTINMINSSASGGWVDLSVINGGVINLYGPLTPNMTQDTDSGTGTINDYRPNYP